MEAVMRLSEEQLRILITKLTAVIKNWSNEFINITKGDLSLTSTSLGISWYHTLKFNKAAYVIRFNELSKIRISNSEFVYGNLLLLERGRICYYFCKDSNIFHLMVNDNDNNLRFDQTFNHNFGTEEFDLFAVSTVMPLPDYIEMHLNLFNTVDDGFICIDDIPVLESHYDSIITLLDAVINGER